MHKTVHPHPMLHAAAAACAAAVICLPSLAAAADIAWTSTRLSGTMASGKRTSESQAVFANGDKADVSGACTSGPLGRPCALSMRPLAAGKSACRRGRPSGYTLKRHSRSAPTRMKAFSLQRIAFPRREQR